MALLSSFGALGAPEQAFPFRCRYLSTTGVEVTSTAGRTLTGLDVFLWLVPGNITGSFSGEDWQL
jgi:hypothetical protein